MNNFEFLYRLSPNVGSRGARGVTPRQFGTNGSVAAATLRGSGVQPAGPIETIPAAGTNSWPRHDPEGQIDAAKSRGEPPLARLAHSWSAKLDEAGCYDSNIGALD
jgi:hypothetical protein